jgi:hypothetical protein
MNPKPDDIEDIILNDSISTNNHEVNSTSEEKQSSMGNNNKSSIAKEDVPNLIQLDG